MEDILRAAKALIETHGAGAARVAEQRALNADLGGSSATAYIWRQVAAAIRKLQGDKQ